MRAGAQSVLSEAGRRQILAENEGLAKQALRTLAIAVKVTNLGPLADFNGTHSDTNVQALLCPPLAHRSLRGHGSSPIRCALCYVVTLCGKFPHSGYLSSVSEDVIDVLMTALTCFVLSLQALRTTPPLTC